MNTPNNKRRRQSQRQIENTFVQLLQTRKIESLTVTEICRTAGVNRTTFYANYVDIYDLAEAVQRRLVAEVLSLYQEEIDRRQSSHDYLRLFQHIKENQLFYATYFKLGAKEGLGGFGYNKEEAQAYYGGHHVEYHMAFFQAGLNAIIEMWLQNGCRESPEEISAILEDEYFGKVKRF